MDLQQQFNEFRNWAFHFEGPAQKWMWSALAILVGYFLGVTSCRASCASWRASWPGLAKHRRLDTQPKTADHVMIDILGALIGLAFLLVALALAANLLFGYSLEAARRPSLSRP